MTTALTKLLAARAKSDSAAVVCMRELGALCCAKIQMNEFAYSLSGTNPHYGELYDPAVKARLLQSRK